MEELYVITIKKKIKREGYEQDLKEYENKKQYVYPRENPPLEYLEEVLNIKLTQKQYETIKKSVLEVF